MSKATTTTAKKTYPRATVKKIIKGHSNKNISRNVDALVYIDFVLFIHELMRNASRNARASGEKKIAARDIRKVTMSTLRKYKG